MDAAAELRCTSEGDTGMVREAWKLAFTKCWFCQRPGTRSRPWDDSKGNVPVPGWTAAETKLLIQGKGYVRTYHVIDCPLFAEDPRMSVPQETKPTLLSLDRMQNYMSRGYTNNEIARLTGLSVSTVKQKRKKIKEREKLSGK